MKCTIEEEAKAFNITVRQAEALPILVFAKTVEEGCRAARVSRQTFYRWLKEPAFVSAYVEYRETMGEMARNELIASSYEAVNALKTLLDSRNESVRMRAAHLMIREALEIMKEDRTIPEGKP